MHRIQTAWLAGLAIMTCLAAARAADLAAAWSCTGPCASGACSPACSATWHEEKTKKPEYTMKCEYACARTRDSWHAPPPECRCSPPDGAVYVKKRLYKADGREQVAKVPKYEVTMRPADACDCPACRGGGTGR
jgi:hypothetical protein